MTPMDIFDNMLESIQQFPLECNNYERHIKRLNRDCSMYSSRIQKMIYKLISPNEKKFIRMKKKLLKTIQKKIALTENFQFTVEKQQQKLEELVKISNLDPSLFNFNPLEGHTNAIMKFDNIKTSEYMEKTKKYCICNDKAYGQMICCENPSCAVKWHHFKCVNLSTVPKIVWRCPKCSTIK